jgi:hypothetical protein
MTSSLTQADHDPRGSRTAFSNRCKSDRLGPIGPPEGGRKHRLTPRQVQAAKDLRAAGRSVKEIGQLLGNGKPVSRQTVYRALGMLAT